MLAVGLTLTVRCSAIMAEFICMTCLLMYLQDVECLIVVYITPNLLLRYFLLNFVTFSITTVSYIYHYHIIIKHSIRISIAKHT